MLNDQSKEAQDFLTKHVHARANMLISDILNNLDVNWHITDCAWYEDLFLQPQEQDEEDYLSNSDDYFSEKEVKYRQPYEFWIVSDYFASKLKENNQLLTDHWGFWIWGRETTGQSILIDYIFQKIYNDFKTI